MSSLLLALLLAADLQGDAGTVVIPISPSKPAAVAVPDAGAPALPEARPLGIELKVEPEEITLGQHIAVKLSVEHDTRDVYSLPGFDPAPLAVPQGAPAPAHVREELQGKARTTFSFTLVDLGSLEPKLPDLVLHVEGPDGQRALTVRGRLLKFKSLVKHENQGADDAAHHGPKPPVQVMVRSYLWAGVAVGFLAVVGLALAFVWWRKREKIVTAKLIPEVPYDELALQQLTRLRGEKPWTRGAGRAAIFQLSEIVRGYLGLRLGFNALDLTSEELVDELKQRRLMGLDLAALSEEVRWEDLVKFAKLEPTVEECLRGVERAESIIHHTRPLKAVPAKGADA